jgi:hypothetical protein
MEFWIIAAPYAAFVYGLIHLIASNAKLITRTRQDIQDGHSQLRSHYAAHGLSIALARIGALLITFGIAVWQADLKPLWGILLIVYAIGFLGTTWLTTKRLPKEMPQIPTEKVDREHRFKWWNFAFQFILMALWLYSWRHLYL